MNNKILSAVLAHWLQPMIGTIAVGKMQGIPLFGMAENWIKNLGIVSPSYCIMNDIAPLISGAGEAVIAPMLSRFLAKVDDASLPKIAHAIVDRAIEGEELVLAEGLITFELADLKKLKRLLELNLPLDSECDYVVKTE